MKTIAMYASIQNFRHKTDADLLRLKECGIGGLDIGVYSGLDAALAYMNKGHTAAEAREQLLCLTEAGITYSFNAILEAGTYAATGMGRQSPIILVVKDPAVRERLAKLNAAAMGMDIDPFYGAPELLVVLANKAVPTYLYDGSLVMGNMMNAAADLGVASCWVHRAKEEFESEEGRSILKELGIEGDYEGIGNLILGYAAGPAPSPAPRKADYICCV